MKKRYGTSLRRTVLLLAGMVLVLAGAAAATTAPLLQYNYELSLPAISSGQEGSANTAQVDFSWIGPLRYNSPPNSLPPNCCQFIGTPKAGEYPYQITFTASGSDPEVIVTYSDFSGSDFSSSNTLTFTFIQPDSFWAVVGTQNFLVDGSGTATFEVGGIDPNCQSCTLTTTTSVMATPEPSSLLLLSAGLAGFAGVIRRKVNR